MDRLKRFEYCDKFWYPHIKEVLNLLGPNIINDFLNDETVQIITSKPLQTALITDGIKV